MRAGEASHGIAVSSGRACDSDWTGARSRWCVLRGRSGAGADRLRPPRRRLSRASRSATATRRSARRAASATRAAAPGAFPIRARPTTAATCWLKNQVPPRIEDKCCVSGVRGAGVIEPRSGPIEYSIDRLRRRLPQFRHRRPTAGAACKAACEAENRCRAWTYVRPGYIGRRRALLSQGQDHAAAAQAVLHFGRRAVADASVHRGEKPRQPQARRPGPDRLAFHAEIPGADDASTRPTRSSTGSRPTPPARDRHAAVGGIVAIVAHDEQMVGRHDDFRHVVERPCGGQLEDRMLAPARQRLDEARGRRSCSRLRFPTRPMPSGSNADRRAVDRHAAVVQRDAVARQADHALDPDLRAVARPAEHDDVAALAASAPRIRAVSAAKR